MSAMGQKLTCAAQKPMSALAPRATAKADIRKRSCLFYPQKQTCAVQSEMSAKGQERTHAAQQKGLLFDQLVRACEQRRRHRKTKSFGGFEIDNQLVLGRGLYRQVRRLLPFKNAVDITGSVPILGDRVGPITDQTTIFYELT